MKYLLPIFVLSLLFTMVTPARAGETLDFILNEQAEWIQLTGDLGYRVIDTKIGVTCQNPREIVYDLAPGSYHVFASGGMYTNRLGISAESDIRGFGDDRDATRYAIMSFVLFEREVVTVTLQPSFSATIYPTDYFCILLVEDEGSGGGLYSSNLAPMQIMSEDPEVPMEMDIDEVPPDPDQWSPVLDEMRTRWADNYRASEYRVARSDIFLVNPEFTKTFNYYYTGYTALLSIACDDRCIEMEVTVTAPDGTVVDTRTIHPGEEVEIPWEITATEPYSILFKALQFSGDYSETCATYVIALVPPPPSE